MKAKTLKFMATVPQQLAVYVEVPDGEGMSQAALAAQVIKALMSGRNIEVRLDLVDLQRRELRCPVLKTSDVPTSLGQFEFMDGGFDDNLPPTVCDLLYGDPRYNQLTVWKLSNEPLNCHRHKVRVKPTDGTESGRHEYGSFEWIDRDPNPARPCKTTRP